MRRLFQLIFFLCFLIPFTAAGEDRSFEATVDTTNTNVASPVTLTLTFYGAQDLAAPKLPVIEGFSVQYYGPATRMSIVNGKSSTSIAHNYMLMPVKAGSFEIPAVTVDYKGQNYTSMPIKIEVSAQLNNAVSQGAPVQAPGQLNASDLKDRIFIFTEAPKRDVYVGEAFILSVKLYVGQLRVNDVQYPQFTADGLDIGEFTKPRQYAQLSNGINYDVIEFDVPVKAKRAGSLDIGAQIGLSLLAQRQSQRNGRANDIDSFFGGSLFEGFFDRYQAYPMKLDAPKVVVNVKELPLEGKPADFNGLIGDYTLNVEAGPREVKVGDPITLRVTILGDGDLKNVAFPAVDLKSDFKVYEPSSKLTEKSKEFEEVIVPLNSTVREIPSFTLSFFDTRTGEYRKESSAPIAVKVDPAAKEERVAKVFDKNTSAYAVEDKPQVLGRDIVFIKAYPGRFVSHGTYLYSNPWYYLAILLLMSVSAGIIFFERHKQRMQTDSKYARGLLAPRAARSGIKAMQGFMARSDAQAFYDRLFKTLQDYLGGRFHIPSAGITAGLVDEFLRPKNVDEDILKKLKELFNECDMARFAAGQFSASTMSRSLADLQAVVDYLERLKL